LPSKSSSKGKSGERELCKYLSEIFGGSFIRSDNSGAFIGGANAHRKALLSKTQITSRKADIIPPDHMPNLVVESKFYKDFRFHQLLQPGPVPMLDEWIKQCIDVIDENDFWIVCFKINLRGWFVAVPETFFDKLVFENYAIYHSEHGIFRITEGKTFISNNKDAILELSS
jgi:hypothetical protein